MNYYIDIGCESINKYGEELCGDKVEIISSDEYAIVVMSDGLGSGVKANILASLTSKIAGTMLKEGATIAETIDTIINTLPACKIRNIAYSTFTIIKLFYDGRVYIAEYDNPPFFLIGKKRKVNVKKRKSIIRGKVVYECNFELEEGDALVVTSDGVIHAGIGDTLNLGWQWENVNEYLTNNINDKKCSKIISKELLEVCQNLYCYKPGDDATVVSIRKRRAEIIDLFTGPPLNRENDKLAVENLMAGNGRKIVCGGTAANIVARELGENVIVDIESIEHDLPPTADIKGIDLVTEGVLTLSKASEIIKGYRNGSVNNLAFEAKNSRNGALKLAQMLIEDCTHINIWLGEAINPAHQNPDFPKSLCMKKKLVEEIAEGLTDLGKKIKINYV